MQINYGIEFDDKIGAELLIAILLDPKTDNKTKDNVLKYWNDDHSGRRKERRWD